ncbi:lysosomal proton-coupled steroid conjugate and bile acid symporter SLC46A3-like [Lineus longissimus]|uniref:lysosomal proton-coupled steroid conjugate and bile acid symporter SLC46A3-like n=1 Tax=Lineus longissimus TaxID=88925 RepID=UPI00315CB351
MRSHHANDKAAILPEEILPEGVDPPLPDVQERTKPTTRLITVEPVLLLYCVAYLGGLAALEEYIYSRYQKNYPILNNTDPNVRSNDSQCQTNRSDPVFIATQMAQSDTSQLVLETTAIFSVLSIFSTMFLGAYSDAYGRKRCLVLPLAAEIVVFILKLAIIYFDLPVELLCIGAAIEGLSGGWIIMLMATFAYIADVTDQSSRAMRITVAESCLTLSIALSQFVLGYYVTATGFFWPYLTLFGLLVIDLLYLILFVPESFVKSKETTFSLKKSVKATYQVYNVRDDNRHIKLVLLTLTMFFNVIPLTSTTALNILFTMNAPLCWGPVLIGIFSAVYALAKQIGGIAGVATFGRLCHLSDISMATIGTVAGIAGAILNAFAKTNVLMFIVCPVSCLSMMTSPMIRTAISRLVKPDELGSVYAGIAAVEAVCNLVGGTVMNLIYQQTLYFFSGFVFIVCAIFFLVELFLFCLYMFVSKSTKRTLINAESCLKSGSTVVNG